MIATGGGEWLVWWGYKESRARSCLKATCQLLRTARVFQIDMRCAELISMFLGPENDKQWIPCTFPDSFVYFGGYAYLSHKDLVEGSSATYDMGGRVGL